MMAQTLIERERRAHEFIGELDRLEDIRDANRRHKNRAAMAALRSGFGRRPEELYGSPLGKYVVPYLSDTVENPNDKWFFLVGALYAFHPQNTRRGISFGGSMKPLSEKSDSIESRFLALLTSHSADVYKHLSQAVSLLKTDDIEVNYERLLNDLCNWDHPERRVQMLWARDYYPRIIIEESVLTEVDTRGETTE